MQRLGIVGAELSHDALCQWAASGLAVEILGVRNVERFEYESSAGNYATVSAHQVIFDGGVIQPVRVNGQVGSFRGELVHIFAIDGPRA